MRENVFRPNSPPVIHETIDGETVIVNLVSGTYYQLTGVGAEVWEALVAGLAMAEISEAITGRYGLTNGTAEGDVTELVRQLRDEELIVADPTAARGTYAETPSRGDYRPPRLARFTDMQDLLLLDPVHEADDTGWPSAPA